MKKMNFNLKNKLIVAIILSLCISGLVYKLHDTNFMESLNNQFYDYKTNLFAETLAPDSNIVMIVIDQGSLDYFEKNAINWPWPRSFYGIVLDFLNQQGAKSVLFDIDFSSNEVERLESDSKSSQMQFAEAIQNSKNTVLIASLENRTIPENSLKPKYFNKYYLQGYKGNYNSILGPVNVLQDSTDLIGIANMEKDRDGIIRSVPLIFNFYNSSLFNASLVQYISGEIQQTDADQAIKNIPLNSDGKFTINWYGVALDKSRFQYYPFYKIFTDAISQKSDASKDPSYNFKNKYVIVGGAAFGLLDYKPTPIWNGPPFPGMEIHATVLSNLIMHHYIKSIPELLFLFVVLIVCLLVSISVFFFNRKTYVLLILAAIVILFIGIDFFLFAVNRINVGSGESVLSLILIIISSSFFAFVFEGREKRNIKKIFGRYLSPHVISELLTNPKDLHLAGKEAEVTVFFSDIENFTNISEKLNPVELVSILNSYFSFVSEIILSYEAMLDKYIGDSVMAIFGAPLHMKDHALMACKAALRIKSAGEKFNEESKVPLSTRMGINTGEVVMGNVGSSHRLDYTAIGDPVNLASRLESANKYFGTKILISEYTYQFVKNQIISREIDLIKVKGKDNPVRIYELIDLAENGSNTDLSFIEQFDKALKLYRDGKFDDAEKLFAIIVEKFGDQVSKVYIKRIEELRINPAGHQPDGVHIFLTK